jgi:hypothetical protein
MMTTNSETQALDNYIHIADGSRVFIVQDSENDGFTDNTKEEKDDLRHYWNLLNKYTKVYVTCFLISI